MRPRSDSEKGSHKGPYDPGVGVRRGRHRTLLTNETELYSVHGSEDSETSGQVNVQDVW